MHKLLEVTQVPSELLETKPVAFSQCFSTLPNLPTALCTSTSTFNLTQALSISHKTSVRASPNLSQVSVSCQVDLLKLALILSLWLECPVASSLLVPYK